jgi:hypothetical protein
MTTSKFFVSTHKPLYYHMPNMHFITSVQNVIYRHCPIIYRHNRRLEKCNVVDLVWQYKGDLGVANKYIKTFG